MDNLKTILENGNYDLVINLTNDTQDPESLLCRAAAFTSLGKAQEAMDIYVFKRKQFFYKHPLRTLKINFELRFTLNQFDEAYEDLVDFNTFPYASQEVEEYLAKLPQIIRENEKASYVYKMESPYKTICVLKDGSDIEVLTMLDRINSNPRDEYLPYVIDILTSDRHFHVRSYALLMLVAWQYDKQVVYKGPLKDYILVPSKLNPPFTGEQFNNFIYELDTVCKDPSLSNTAANVFNSYILLRYPEKVLSDDETENHEILVALYSIANDYLGSDYNISALIVKYNLQKDVVETTKNRIKTLMESIKPLL